VVQIIQPEANNSGAVVNLTAAPLAWTEDARRLQHSNETTPRSAHVSKTHPDWKTTK
jgi:hypothetical protein